MAVYPFYISTQADGRKTDIQGGTKRAYGDMTTTVYQRDRGAITTPFKIRQYSIESDEFGHQLVTDIYYNGELIKTHITNY